MRSTVRHEIDVTFTQGLQAAFWFALIVAIVAFVVYWAIIGASVQAVMYVPYLALAS